MFRNQSTFDPFLIKSIRLIISLQNYILIFEAGFLN
jgi:hypothetical protein